MDKILAVDDEVGFTNALRRFFKKEGYEVITANSGEEALAKFSGRKT